MPKVLKINQRNSSSFIAPVARCVLLVLLLLGSQSCATANREMPKRDVNAVLRDNDKTLMAVPGVVGVYVGVLADGHTPCLRVMVVKKTAQLEQTIPKTLEGYKVEIEETGVIRPM